MSKNPLGAIWDKYGAEISIGLVVLGAWKLRGLFSGLGSISGAVGDAVAGATANMQQTAKKSQQKAAVKTVNPKASDADVQKFEDDAEALAQATGAKSMFTANAFNTNWRTAYAVAKKYSRRVTRVYNGKLIDLGPRKDELTLPVLNSFYRDASNGRSLVADLDQVMLFAPKANQDFYRKYIK